MKGSQGERGYDSDVLLKGKIMANKFLFCFLGFILRLHEARVSVTDAKGGLLKKFKNL